MKINKNITEFWDKIDPFLIDSYIKKGGYEQLSLCVAGKIKPVDIIKAVEESGLQGRGGAGFATGKKWRIAYETGQKTKQSPYLIINGDESQPGTFKDRYIINKNPHQVVEGAAIAAYALGARKVFIYINGECREQLAMMKQAISSAAQKGFFSKEKLDLKIRIIRGAGGYIYGEETALINSLSGNRGEPRIKPPYPPVQGLFDRPTVVNNVETIINVPIILKIGAASFKESGLFGAAGTKLYSVTGSIKNPGVYELPLGTSTKEVLKVAGGMERGKKLAFARVGGVGNFVLKEKLDFPLTYGCKEGRVPVGLGNVLVVDKETDLSGLILAWAGFYERESCGQCTPCREGTYHLLEIARRLKDKRLSVKDYANLLDILDVLEKTSFCSLGSFAAQDWKEVIRVYGKKYFQQRVNPAVKK